MKCKRYSIIRPSENEEWGLPKIVKIVTPGRFFDVYNLQHGGLGFYFYTLWLVVCFVWTSNEIWLLIVKKQQKVDFKSSEINKSW